MDQHHDARDRDALLAERAARCDPFERYPEGHERAGEHVIRDATCESCGERFTQHRLSRFFIELAREQSLFAERVLDDALPEHWTPRLCPKCEREDLDRRARLQLHR